MPGPSSHWLRPTTEMMARMREMARWKKPNPKTAFWRGIPKKELMHMIVLQVEFRTDMRNVEGITHTQRVLIRAQPLLLS